LRIVRDWFERGVGAKRVRIHPGRRRRGAGIERLVEALAVERVVDRLAHFRLRRRQRWIEVAHAHDEYARARHRLDLGTTARGDDRDQLRRNVEREVDLAGEQRAHARCILLDRPVDHRLDPLRPMPIAVHTLQHDAGVGHMLHKAVRPGADRPAAIAVDADLGDIFRRQHMQEGELRRGRWERLVGREAHRILVDHIDLLDESVVRLRGRLHGRIEHRVEGKFHHRGIEGFAVVEFHAFAQRDLPGQRVDVLPGQREAGAKLAGFLPPKQRVSDMVHEEAVRREHDDIHAVHSHRIGTPGNDHPILRAQRRADREY